MRKLIFDEIRERRLDTARALAAKRHPVAGVLEDVRSLYNVGACFRTADAMLLDRIVCCGYTPTPPRPEIEKTALGATTTVPWESHDDPLLAIASIKKRGYHLLALEITSDSLSIEQAWSPEIPVAFVVGNELRGLRESTLAACDGAIEIPMFGTKHSLNVAVAFGIAAWELVRRVRAQPGGYESA